MSKRNGFSLVELMVTLGIMSAVAMGYMQLMSHQTKQNKTNMAAIEVNNLHTEIRAYLSKTGVCTKTYENLSLTDDLKISAIKKQNGKNRFQVERTYGDRSIKLKKFILNNYEEELNNPLKVSADLNVVMEKVGKVYGAKIVTKKIPLEFIIDQNDKIIDCGVLGANSLATITLPSQEKPNAKNDHASLVKTIQQMHTDPSKVNPDDAKKVQAIIDANPQLKQMQEMIKNMQQMQKQQEKLFQEE